MMEQQYMLGVDFMYIFGYFLVDTFKDQLVINCNIRMLCFTVLLTVGSVIYCFYTIVSNDKCYVFVK